MSAPAGRARVRGRGRRGCPVPVAARRSPVRRGARAHARSRSRGTGCRPKPPRCGSGSAARTFVRSRRSRSGGGLRRTGPISIHSVAGTPKRLDETRGLGRADRIEKTRGRHGRRAGAARTRARSPRARPAIAGRRRRSRPRVAGELAQERQRGGRNDAAEGGPAESSRSSATSRPRRCGGGSESNRCCGTADVRSARRRRTASPPIPQVVRRGPRLHVPARDPLPHARPSSCRYPPHRRSRAHGPFRRRTHRPPSALAPGPRPQA